MAHVIRKIRRALFDVDPSFCDMYEDAGARAAGEEYLRYIRRHIHERFGDRRVSILDAGCQAGRLLIPLAEEGHRMIGLDASAFSLRRARRHVKARQLSIPLHKGGLINLRRWIPPSSMDVVICTEVLYLCRNYRQLLQLFADSVKPEGLLFVSHRPTLYYVACALQHGQLDQVDFLLTRTEGCDPDGAYHNWQTQEQLIELYRSLNLTCAGCYPIGDQIIQPDLSVMSPEASRLLASVRSTDSTFSIPTYVLVAAQKAECATPADSSPTDTHPATKFWLDKP